MDTFALVSPESISRPSSIYGVSGLSSSFYRHMALLHGDLWWAIGTLLCEGKTIALVAFPSLLCLIDGEFRLQALKINPPAALQTQAFHDRQSYARLHLPVKKKIKISRKSRRLT